MFISKEIENPETSAVAFRIGGPASPRAADGEAAVPSPDEAKASFEVSAPMGMKNRRAETCAFRFLMAGVFFLGLAACTSYPSLRETSPPIPEKHPAQTRLTHLPNDASAADLEEWAEGDSKRLQEAARILLTRSASPKRPGQGGRSGYALAVCELAWQSLICSGVPASQWLQDPDCRASIDVYNSALEKFISEQTKVVVEGSGTFEYASPLGPIIVTPGYGSKSPFGPGYFDELIPASSVRKTGFTEAENPNGLGVALVGVRKRTPARAKEMQFQFPKRNLNIALSAVATFSRPKHGPTRMRLSFHDPRRNPSVASGSSRVLMTADFAAPLALSFAGRNDLETGIRGLFNLEAGFGSDGIYLSEPFDPDRTPVLLLHGLFASPLVWRNVVAKSLENPGIRENYQFWYGFFSTGMPLTPSIARLRARIVEIRRTGDPTGNSRASKNMILIGHSMGGVVARALATDIGDHYWDTLYDIPFQELTLKPDTKDILRSWFFWEPASDIKRIIFLATPHHGTEMANLDSVRLSQAILEWPKNLIEFTRFVLSAGKSSSNNDQLRTLTRPFTPTFSNILSAIDSLAPDAPLYKAFDQSPLVDGVSTHSLIGDRGRPAGPGSSDGVIEYWSSQLPSVQSETILPVNHDLQSHPQCAVEIQGILLEDLKP